MHKLRKQHEKKWQLFYRLFNKKGRLGSLNRLKMLVSSQIRQARKLPEADKLIKSLEQQKALLSKPKLRKEYAETILSLEEEAVSLLKKEELLISQIDRKLSKVKPKKRVYIKLNKKQAEQAAKVILAINKSLITLSKAIGNRKEVQKTTKILFKQLARLQHTAIYGFVKEDAGRIKKTAKLIIQNPKEAKLKQMLAGVYLVAPFTFDATGAVIVLRYAAKYAHEKSKRLRANLKKAIDKRRRQIRVF